MEAGSESFGPQRFGGVLKLAYVRTLDLGVFSGTSRSVSVGLASRPSPGRVTPQPRPTFSPLSVKQHHPGDPRFLSFRGPPLPLHVTCCLLDSGRCSGLENFEGTRSLREARWREVIVTAAAGNCRTGWAVDAHSL